MRAGELSELVYGSLGFYVMMYLLFAGLYLLVYRKAYWSLFDPMLYTVMNLIGGAFCVWLMYYQNLLKPFYGWSFIYTDLGLLTGVLAAQILPVIKIRGSENAVEEYRAKDYVTEFDVFIFVISASYIVVEIISIMTIGIVLLSDEDNHVSAFKDHGILRAFIASYRILMIAALSYKKLVLGSKWNLLDMFCLALLFFGVLTSGSKGSILAFVWMFFLISYPLVRSGKLKQFKIPLPLLIGLGSFPVIVIMVSVGAEASSAVQQLYVRLLSAGDIFLLGYYDSVMDVISETSFFKYAFYPGWGSILKNLGFNITPPRQIGSDIFEFYTSNTFGGGPNARHNYVGLHFFGLYWSILYSFIIGVIVGYMRNIFKNLDPHRITYIFYLFFVLIAYYISTLIDDINFFANYIFWSSLFLATSYLITKILYSTLKALVIAQQKNHSLADS